MRKFRKKPERNKLVKTSAIVKMSIYCELLISCTRLSTSADVSPNLAQIGFHSKLVRPYRYKGMSMFSK